MDDVVFEDLSAALRVVPRRRPGVGGAPRRARGDRPPDLEPPPRRPRARPRRAGGGGRAAPRRARRGGGARPLGAEDLEALRILEGQARFGADMDATRLPMEAGLTRLAISFTKGCYTGQEVVLRATARGHLQRGLVQLVLPPGAGPATPLSAGGQEVGLVTSAAETPEGRLGLGYLRRAHWKEGERVATPAGEAVVRRVLVEDGDRRCPAAALAPEGRVRTFVRPQRQHRAAAIAPARVDRVAAGHDLLHRAVLVDDEGRAVRDPEERDRAAVLLRDLPALVREERERELVLVLEPLLGRDVVRRDADDLRPASRPRWRTDHGTPSPRAFNQG